MTKWSKSTTSALPWGNSTIRRYSAQFDLDYVLVNEAVGFTNLHIDIFSFSVKAESVKLPICQISEHRAEHTGPPLLMNLIPNLQTP